MLMPSTPRLCAFTAWRTDVHLCRTLMPLSWNIGRCGAGLEPAVSTILMPSLTMTRRYSSYGGGLIAGRIVKFTPNGLSVSLRVLSISRARSAGVGCVSAVMKPRPPALATAATNAARPTHCMPPCATGCSTPNVSVNFVVIVIGLPLSSRKRSSGRHPDRAVEADHFTVQHRVLDDVHGERAVLVGVAEPSRVWHLLTERLLRLLGQRAQQRRLEQPRRDRADTDQFAGQVAGDRQRHADNATLGRRVRGLPDLALEGGDGRGVDDDAAFLADRFVLGDPLGREPQHVERADEVDLDGLGEPVQRERSVLAQGLGCAADACAVDVDPQRAQRLGEVERLAHGGLVGDVGGGELHALAELAQFIALAEVD